MRVALSAGRHAIVFDEPATTAQIAGNEAELLSAIGNLVNNAVRYTPDGGRIDVALAAAATTAAGELVVSDTGVGIAREHLPRLTERFYRVDGSRSRDTGRHRPGPGDRQARGAAPWRRARRRRASPARARPSAWSSPRRGCAREPAVPPVDAEPPAAAVDGVDR